MNDSKTKQQIVAKIKDASNILVTVSRDPSVDELSAALGLTLLLNKMEKHATAIFSGQTPPAITFLEPDKTFEGTTDSLRDFIIALDKEKADHLRYKLEGDLVKIYITPYRTTISSDDLEFSQGDYNVELVIALGVENKNHLDAALDGHGKILHDATVVTLTAGKQTSNLGSIDWHDSNASSLSEMLITLYDSMKLEKKLLDKPIATAFLTGIVSATERFSNPRTSSRAMTQAANLMAAGADQQLIAAKLEESQEVVEADAKIEHNKPQPAGVSDNQKVVLNEGESTKLKGAEEANDSGELVINRQKEDNLDEVAKETHRERLEESAQAAREALEKQTAATTAVEAEPEVKEPTVAPEVVSPAVVSSGGAVDFTPSETQPAMPIQDEPLLGGTLNATSERAQEDKRREMEKNKNKVILSHNYVGPEQPPVYNSPVNSVSPGSNEGAPINIFSNTSADEANAIMPPTTPTFEAPAITPPSEDRTVLPAPEVPTLPPPPPVTPVSTSFDTGPQMTAVQPQEDARAAIDAAFAASPAPQEMPPTPPPVPQAPPMPPAIADIGLPLPPPLPDDFSAGIPPMLPDTEPDRLGDILAPEHSPGIPAPVAMPQAAPPPATPNDPGQFRIPGQS